jgi:hypothetical protein
MSSGRTRTDEPHRQSGSTVSIVVGGAGGPGSGAGNQRGAAAGANGGVTISWS